MKSMRYAIDRYSVGMEVEVNADDFDDCHYIPRRRTRFFCPECGEIVYFRSKGGKHPNHFYHQEKTDRTPECDRRVDGHSEMSLSQRVGLPLYLIKTILGNFQLSIGFPALDEVLFSKVVQAHYTVEISYGSKSRKVAVDYTNFIENELTRIPVDFVPDAGKKYNITISGEHPIQGLHRKWADYVDGFDYDGAIFTYAETGGKKVRRGDSISTNKSYYVVTKNNLPSYQEIKREDIGQLVLGSVVYKILKVEIAVCIDDKATFSVISEYIKDHFGVWLLECQPELIPLWPPVTEQEVLIPLSNKSTIVCAVSSRNVSPTVYTYSEYGVFQQTKNPSTSGMFTVEFAVEKRPVVLSVDRKYVGREATFQKKTIIRSNYSYEMSLTLQDGKHYFLNNLTEKELSSNFEFMSNSKAELYVGTRDKMFRHFTIRDKKTVVPKRIHSNQMYILVETNVLLHVEIPYNKKSFTRYSLEVEQIKNNCRGVLVQIPRWVEYMIRRCKEDNNQILFEAVKVAIVNGRIYLGVLKQLRELGIENGII